MKKYVSKSDVMQRILITLKGVECFGNPLYLHRDISCLIGNWFLTSLISHKILSIVVTVMQAAGQNNIIIVALEIKRDKKMCLVHNESFMYQKLGFSHGNT